MYHIIAFLKVPFKADRVTNINHNIFKSFLVHFTFHNVWLLTYAKQSLILC